MGGYDESVDTFERLQYMAVYLRSSNGVRGRRGRESFDGVGGRRGILQQSSGKVQAGLELDTRR
jgi:hypothetical protein